MANLSFPPRSAACLGMTYPAEVPGLVIWGMGTERRPTGKGERGLPGVVRGLAVAATDGGGQQRRVVIACQGGGSHTAFTAGVLKRLLGAEELVKEQLSAGVRLDLTHKLIARERVTWTLRIRSERAGPDLSGQAEAQFRDGKITSPPGLRRSTSG
jgi:hypothetical protein